MHLKKILALLMAMAMVFTMAACGGKDAGTTGTTGTTTNTEPTNTQPTGTEPTDSQPSSDVTYSVSVKDVLGNPYTENIIVIFLQGGEQVAMQPVNAEGTAAKVLPAGEYQIQLQVTKNAEDLHYASEGLVVTAENPALEITMSNRVIDEYEVLMVNGMERCVFVLTVNADGTLQLEDMKGDLSGTYHYAENDDGGYDVTNADGDEVGVISVDLDGVFTFSCDTLNFAQQMVQQGDATEDLSGVYHVLSNEYEAYFIRTGCTYLELNAAERNYVMYTPQQSGIYEITVHNATATVGYYGSPYFVLTESSAEVTGPQSITVEVKESMIGTNGTGTVQWVIGIDAEEGNDDCIISVVRIGDCVLMPEEMPWNIYEGTYVPTKYTLPEGLNIHEFDLTASYNIVFNEADGFYHLNSVDGPVVLVRLDAVLAYGGCFGNMLAGMNVGVYFYDEEGNFVKKELYNDCLLQYLGTLNKGMGTHSYSGGMLDDNYGVYPLTQDLMYIIQTYGEYTGWWRADASNYLFGSLLNLNVDSAWLFMCCYAA